jgi:hypothetical protein
MEKCSSYMVLFVLMVAVPALGDVTGKYLSRGECLCTNDRTNLRTSACGTFFQTINSGECYTYGGSKNRCYLQGQNYEFVQLNYKGTTRWAAGSLLNSLPASRCGGSGGGSSGGSGGTTAGKLSDRAARSRLSAAGISVNYEEPTTSLNNIREASISGIINFKRASKCNVMVTGGTEPVHGSSTATAKSHVNGFKLDIRMDSCVTNYIINNYRHTASDKWRDGTELYFDPRGNQFARETKPPHWDIVFQ